MGDSSPCVIKTLDGLDKEKGKEVVVIVELAVLRDVTTVGALVSTVET